MEVDDEKLQQFGELKAIGMCGSRPRNGRKAPHPMASSLAQERESSPLCSGQSTLRQVTLWR